MNPPNCRYRKVYFAWLATLAWLCGLAGGGGTRPAQGQELPTLPPGVTVPEASAGAGMVPREVRIYEVDVDWTHAELRATLVPGAGGREGAAEANSRELHITLSLPSAEGEGDEPATEYAEKPKAGRATGAYELHQPEIRDTDRGPDQVRVGGIVPWTYVGAGVAGEPGWNAALIEGSGSVGLQWLGKVEAWIEAPPRVQFRDRILLSTLNPMTGQGQFLLVVGLTGRPLRLDVLTPWLAEAIPGHYLLAVHGGGKGVGIRQGDWKIEGEGALGTAQRGGGELVLSAREPGAAFDLARLASTRVTASSREFAYPPGQAVSGRLWPVALRPSVWMSRPPERETDEAAWYELELAEAQPVERVRLIHAGAAGWSADFNPGLVRVWVYERSSGEPSLGVEVRPEGADVSTIEFSSPRMVSRVKVEWLEASGADVPSPARLMAIQVWGRAGDEP